MLPLDCSCEDDMGVSPDPDTAGAVAGEVLSGATSADRVGNAIDVVADEGDEVETPRPKEASPDPDAAGAFEVLKARGGTAAVRVDNATEVDDDVVVDDMVVVGV